MRTCVDTGKPYVAENTYFKVAKVNQTPSYDRKQKFEFRKNGEIRSVNQSVLS
jgi:hypothetical protein